MFETVTTNVPSIMTLIVLWSTLVWVGTYMYMTEKIRRKDETIRFLDHYIELCEDDYRKVKFELDSIEQQFGHVLDDYIEHYFEPYTEYEVQDDGSWKRVH